MPLAMAALFACASALVCAPRPPHAFARHRPVIAQYSGETSRGLEALTPAQQKAFLSVVQSDDFVMADMVNADDALWNRVRETEPALGDLSDDELQTALTSYINTGPNLVDVLLKTPVGPVFLINIVLAATGLSWCDVPFFDHDTAACVQLAARTNG